MNLIRQSDFFNPLAIKEQIHVVGLGAIGSHVAEQLVRMGVAKITLWDFDTVDEHNIPNQLYSTGDIGLAKVDALAIQLQAINPQVSITKRHRWEPGIALNGYIFMCVDSINVRQQIVDQHMYAPTVPAIFDFRMRLTDAQHFAGCPGKTVEITNLRASMDFTQEEAKEATPVSACGTSMAVLPTIRVITAIGVANFMNFVKTGDLKTMILIDAFSFDIQAFSKR